MTTNISQFREQTDCLSWEGESLRMDRRNNVIGRGRVRMRGGRRGGRAGGGQERGRGGQRLEISDEIWATVIDHLLVHGLTMREAGLRMQPNLSRFSVSTIVRTFKEENSYSILLYFCHFKFTVLHYMQLFQ